MSALKNGSSLKIALALACGICVLIPFFNVNTRIGLFKSQSTELLASGIYKLFGCPRCIHCCKSACIANLKQIEGAKACWALELKKQTNASPADSDLFGTNAYIRMKPECPGGGTYNIGGLWQRPLCSVPGHTL